MMFDWFGRPTRTYSQYMTNMTRTECTSWYGHQFEKFNETTLFCPTCGQTRKVTP